MDRTVPSVSGRSSRTSEQTSLAALHGKRPPSSIEAERAVLGALLLHDDHVLQVLELVQAQDFYLPAHQHLFTCMTTLAQANKRIDVVTLQDELERAGVMDAVGGPAYLLALQEDLPTVGLLDQHARLIKEKSVLRQLIGSAAQIMLTCYAQNERKIDEVLDEAERAIMQIAEKRSPQTFVQLPIWLKKTFQQLSALKNHGSEVTGIATGFKTLDSMTAGLQPQDLIVLAARPAMGKTALALRLAQTAASAGSVVGFFSLEMAGEQLMVRLLSIESGVAHHQIRNASLSSDDWVDLTHVASRILHYKLFIDDSPMQTIINIRTKARKLKRDHNLQLLVIDYLQLILAAKQHENRHQEVSEISRSLKALAKELGIPIIALSQLSRAVDSRVDKRPMLSDLRESGAIEQDADLILFLYRDVVYHPDTQDPNGAELIIGKQRNGPTGTVHMTFHRELTLFEESAG